MDASSKTLIGVFTNNAQPENTELLVAVRIHVCIVSQECIQWNPS